MSNLKLENKAGWTSLVRSSSELPQPPRRSLFQALQSLTEDEKKAGKEEQLIKKFLWQ